jgi:hypothetical protein
MLRDRSIFRVELSQLLPERILESGEPFADSGLLDREPASDPPGHRAEAVEVSAGDTAALVGESEDVGTPIGGVDGACGVAA